MRDGRRVRYISLCAYYIKAALSMSRVLSQSHTRQLANLSLTSLHPRFAEGITHKREALDYFVLFGDRRICEYFINFIGLFYFLATT